MTVTVNAGFFVLIGVVFKAQMWDTFKPVCGVLMCAIGALTILYGYRLYRASRLAQKIICELRDRFDDARGVEGVVRTTRDLKSELPKFGRFSSRNAMAYAFVIWGAFEAVAGLVCLIAFGLC